MGGFYFIQVYIFSQSRFFIALGDRRGREGGEEEGGRGGEERRGERREEGGARGGE